MPTTEAYRTAWIATVQERVPEPVRGILGISRAGSLSRLGVGKVSPIASIAMGSAAKEATGGFPENVLVSITDATLHVFSYRQGNRGIKLKDELATWPRNQVTVTTERGTTLTKITVGFADGTSYAFESNNLSDFNDPGIALLNARGDAGSFLPPLPPAPGA
jgi:hypothetical protein